MECVSRRLVERDAERRLEVIMKRCSGYSKKTLNAFRAATGGPSQVVG